MRKYFLLIIFALLMGSNFASESKSIGIFINGRTEVNRETVNMIFKSARREGLSLNFKVVENASDLNKTNFDHIVVLSTGETGSIEGPSLEAIKSTTAKSKVILVSLLKQGLWKIDYIKAKDTKYGVDTIASATTWKLFSYPGKGSTFNNPIVMHEEWVSHLLDELQK